MEIMLKILTKDVLMQMYFHPSLHSLKYFQIKATGFKKSCIFAVSESYFQV